MPPQPPISLDHIASAPPPKPGTATSKSDENRTRTTQTNGTASSTTPNVEFIYRLVTRVPTRLIRRWHPTQKLEETTFAQFTDEVTDSKDARWLIFRVEVNDIDIVNDVRRGNEIEFDQLKKLIKRTIKEASGSRGPTDQPLACVLEIEPVMDNDVVSQAGVDKVGDFTF